MYCAESDLYDYGLPRGSLPNPGRLVYRFDTARNSVQQDQHGFSSGSALSFRAEAGGTLPIGLTANTTYYALPISQDEYQVAATVGGSAVVLGTAGTGGVLAITAVPVAAAIAFATELINDMLPAHLVPVPEPIPAIIRMTAAELAAAKLGAVTGHTAQSLSMTVDGATKRLARWGQGVPIRGATPEVARANLAISAAASPVDSRGWRRFGGL